MCQKGVSISHFIVKMFPLKLKCISLYYTYKVQIYIINKQHIAESKYIKAISTILKNKISLTKNIIENDPDK